VAKDITEEFQYDLSYQSQGSSFQLTNVGYDISLADIPFILKIDNQNPYRRETAPYKKDQFDNSPEPGEQSLTGWWVRSQTSWHNGAGIEFYEPGTDYEHVSHRFADSRGVDIWTVGELRLHKRVFQAYTGIQGINAATGNDGTVDCLISGDADGVLKKIVLNANSAVTTTNNYSEAGATTTLVGHSTTFPILSVATTGTRYYAACSTCIHTGLISNLDTDTVFARHGATTNAIIKYAKGYLFFGDQATLYLLKTTYTGNGNHSGASDIATGSDGSKLHINTNWVWKDVTAGPSYIYAAGSAGNKSEIYAIGFDETTNLPDMSGAFVVLSMPDGEVIQSINYYLGAIAIGTSKGVRICTVDLNGVPTLGPLLIETSYAVNGFTQRGTYLYAATKVDSGTDTNAVLIRIDLSQQFDDGTYAYAYDLEYESSLDGDSSNCTEVYNLNDGTSDRLVMVVQEDSDTVKGELQVEHRTEHRSSGYLQTGKIRYGTVEPKFFKYLQTRGLVPTGDSISVKTIDNAGNEYDIITLDSVSMGENVTLGQPNGSQEFIALKFVLTNGDPTTSYPVMQSYQVKSIPGVVRQRLYQYPLSCFDVEMDRFNSQFGYIGRAFDVIQALEELEGLGNFITIRDFRTGETYQGIIEEVKFSNESSPDKDSNGYGGLLLVLIRRLA
jgi:hypothetical protein